MKKIILVFVGICLALLLTQFIVSENDSSVLNITNEIVDNETIANSTLVVDNISSEVILGEENIIEEKVPSEDISNKISYDKQKTELTKRLNGDTKKSKFRVSTSQITGKVKFIGSDLSNAIVHPSSFDADSVTSEDAARQFLLDYGNYLGIKDENEELSLTYSKNLVDGRAVVRMQQEYNGVPVFGGEIIVQMNSNKNILSVGSKIMPDLNVDTEYNLNGEDASERALNAIAKYYHADASSLQTTTPELWIYDPRVFGENSAFVKNPVLVWRMDVYNDDLFSPVNELILVDANNGKIVLHFTQIYTAKYRKVYDKNNVRDDALPGSTLVRVEGGAASEISDANYAYNYSGDTYDFYYNYFDRDSIDDLGMNLTSTVRFCYTLGTCPTCACPYANAFWNGEQMTYGNGYSSADDVVAHEMSHGVTEHESNLFYYMQSGAINEAFSDIMGEFVDLTNNAGDDSDEVRWLMGEDLSIGAIRSASNPTLYGDPDAMNSTNYVCDTWDQDNGGVHTNGGVANKAAYLITDGDTFSGYTISGIGINKTAQLFYEANTNLLTSGSDYGDLYDALTQAAINLDFNSSERLTVEKAINATQMNKAVVCTMTEAPVCDSGTINNLFFDDLENISSGNWVNGTNEGANAWYYPQDPNAVLTGPYATSGQYNIWGYDAVGSSDSYIKMNLNVSLQVGTEPYMHFKHSYEFESEDTTYYDGGVIEYSINGGTTWIDGGSLIINNNYTGRIYNDSGNPLANRSAFCGTSYGYTSSRLNLTSLAGQNVRFRFRLGTDELVNDYGWFIDDVRIYTCLTDATAPVVHLISPQNNTFRNFENTSHSFNVTDDSDTVNCTMYWNNFSAPGNSASWTDVSADGSAQEAGNLTSSDGSVIWTVNCTDPSGNTGAGEIWNYTVDTVYPTIDFESDTTASGNHSQNWIYVNITVNETNFNKTILYIYNSTGIMMTIEGNETILLSNTSEETNLSDGTYYFNATTYDLAGNRNSTAIRMVVLDTTPPVITITSIANNTMLSATSLPYNLTGNVSDNIIGVNFTSFYQNGILNKSAVDYSNPGVIWSQSWNPTDGIYNLTIQSCDLLNNCANASVYNITVDLIYPTINFTSPTETSGLINLTRNFILINITANDTNLKNITLRIFNSTNSQINSTNSTTSPLYTNFSSLGDGIYYFNATACDTLNNCNITETRNFTIDANSPIITINSPANNSYHRSVIFNVTLNKNGTCLYSIDGGANKSMSSADNRTFNATNSSMSQIAHNLTFSCNDTYGNINSTVSRTFYFDTTAPVVELISPDDGNDTYEEDHSVSFKYNVTDNFEVDNCSLLIDGAIESTDTGIARNSTETRTYTFSASGSYDWTIRCYDDAGNLHEHSNFTIEIQAVDDDDDGGGGGGGGGGGADTTTATEYSPTSSEFSLGYTQQLKKGEKIKFTLLNQTDIHRITLDSLSSDRAYVTITSDPISLTLIPGKEKKINISSSTYYQLSIKLNSIANNRVNLTIKKINESMGGAQDAISLSGSGNQTGESNETGESGDGWASEGLTDNIKKYKYIFIGAGVLVLGGIACLVWYVRRIIRKRKGWDK